MMQEGGGEISGGKVSGDFCECAHCGAQFAPRRAWQIYCSRQCREGAHHAREIAQHKRVGGGAKAAKGLSLANSLGKAGGTAPRRPKAVKADAQINDQRLIAAKKAASEARADIADLWSELEWLSCQLELARGACRENGAFEAARAAEYWKANFYELRKRCLKALVRRNERERAGKAARKKSSYDRADAYASQYAMGWDIGFEQG